MTLVHLGGRQLTKRPTRTKIKDLMPGAESGGITPGRFYFEVPGSTTLLQASVKNTRGIGRLRCDDGPTPASPSPRRPGGLHISKSKHRWREPSKLSPARASNMLPADNPQQAMAQPDPPVDEEDVGGGSAVVRTKSAKSFVLQHSDGSKRRRGSRRDMSEHEIIRRRSSRQLDRTTTHEESTESGALQYKSSTSEYPRRPSNLSESSRRPSQSSEAPRRPSMSLSVEQLDEIKGKKHAELVERFQIRQIKRPSTDKGTGIRSSRSHSRELDTSSRTSRVPSKAPSRGLEQPTARSVVFNDALRPLQFFQTPITGREATIDQDGRPMHSNRSQKGETTLATARPFSNGPRSERMPLTMQDQCRLVFESLRQPMSPFSTSFRVRQVAMMIALTVHVVYFPLQTAFRDPTAGSALEMAVELVFIMDFLLMFNTSVVDKRGTLITNRQAICRNYLRGWFLPDSVSSIPVEWILVRGNSNSTDKVGAHFLYDILGRVPRIVHAIRLARFIWVLRLDRSDNNVLTWFFYSRYSHLLRIAWIILALVLAAHYLACSWKLLHPVNESTTVTEAYISNFYDVLQLLQGQGVPTTTIEQNIFSAAAILMGSIALAIVFGHVGMLVSNFNANSTNYQRKMESVFAIMSKLQLPAPLRERIHQYYEHLWREYESLDGEIVSFSKGLSHTLELEVVLFKYMDLIIHVPFWRNGSPDFQKQLMLHLSVRVYLPDDFIIRRGEVGGEFFMINRGVCELMLGPDSFETTSAPPLEDGSESGSIGSNGVGSSRSALYGVRQGGDGSMSARRSVPRGDDNSLGRTGGHVGDGSATVRNDRFDKLRAPLTARHPDEDEDNMPAPLSTRVLRRGQTFGELALLMNYERTANVRALTYVEMCVLKRDDIQAIFVKHPKDRKEVITSLLTQSMDCNGKNNVRCPLKAMVQNAIGNDEESSVSAMHAAMMITSVINTERHDESIKFGIGPSLQDRLEAMLRSKHSVQSSNRAENGTQPTRNQTEARISHLEATQIQLLELVQEMRNEVRDMRCAFVAAVEGKRVDKLENGVSLVAKSASVETDKVERILAPEVVHTESAAREHSDEDVEATTFIKKTTLVSDQTQSKSETLPRNISTSQQPDHLSIKPKVRPTMRPRQASYIEPAVHPRRSLARVGSTLSALDSSSLWNPRVNGTDHDQSRGTAQSPLTDALETDGSRTNSQRTSIRSSLMSPLRSFVATLAPAASAAPSAPLADQLFNVRTPNPDD